MKKVLLIQPNMNVATSGQRIIYPPMGIMYIAAVLEEKGYEVAIYDCQTESLDFEAKYVDGYVEGGVPMEEIRGRIVDFAPDCIGISCNFAVMASNMVETARLIKSIDQSIPVVVGGNHVTSMAEEVMEEPEIDYLIRGEGEYALTSLLEALEAGTGLEDVPGLIWRDSGAVTINRDNPYIHDLDALPFPAWHLFPFEKYSKLYKPHTVTWGDAKAMPTVLTSRGCGGTCVFCASNRTMGYKFRSRSLDKVFEEIDWLKEKYGIDQLMVIDDNFTQDKKRAKKFCDRYMEQKVDLKIHFLVFALWCMDEELIDKFHAMGCKSMGVAIESGVQEVLTKVVKKPLKLKRAIELIKYMRVKGIHITGSFVIGFPGETKKDIRRTLYMANYSGLFDSREIYFATPVPGSELYKTCVEQGFLSADFSYNTVEVVKSNISTFDFTPRDIDVILEADRTHHLIKSDPAHILRYVSGVRQRKSYIFFKVLFETLKMFIKYDFFKMKEVYP